MNSKIRYVLYGLWLMVLLGQVCGGPANAESANGGILVSAPYEQLTAGTSMTLTASAAGVTWHSANTQVLAIDSNGVATAQPVDRLSVSVVRAVAPDGQWGAFVVIVAPAPLQLDVDAESVILDINHPQATRRLQASVQPHQSSVGLSLSWASADESIVTVDDHGTLRAQGTGETVVTVAALNGRSTHIPVKVIRSVQRIDLAATATLMCGETLSLAPSLFPPDATDVALTYHSSDPACATVSPAGLIRAEGVGEAVITVTAVSGVTATCTVTVADPPSPLAGRVIGINPGHQTNCNYSQIPVAPGSSEKKMAVNNGTAGVVTRVPEYEVTLAVSFKLRTLLTEAGASVVMTRTENDVNIDNIQRAQQLNAAGVDVALQIHCNSFTDQRLNGIGVYVKPKDGASNPMAHTLLSEMCAATGAAAFGYFESYGYMSLNWSTTPSILVEMGFMSNPVEDRKLVDESYQWQLAYGMYAGLVEYFSQDTKGAIEA